MSVLILKNIRTEGPGTIEDYLCPKEIPCTVVDPYPNQAFRYGRYYDAYRKRAFAFYEKFFNTHTN